MQMIHTLNAMIIHQPFIGLLMLSILSEIFKTWRKRYMPITVGYKYLKQHYIVRQNTLCIEICKGYFYFKLLDFRRSFVQNCPLLPAFQNKLSLIRQYANPSFALGKHQLFIIYICPNSWRLMAFF